jgi:hypothetical protein
MNFNPLDPFAKKAAPNKFWDEVFRKPTGGGGCGKRKSETAAADAREKEAEADFLAGDKVKDPPPDPKEVVTLTNPHWVEKEGFFNDKATASVDGNLPPSLSHPTRVAFTLFASSPSGKAEWVDSKEAHLKDGKASVALDLFRPSFKEPNGDPLKKCGYFFNAKQAQSAEVQSPNLAVSAPPQVRLEFTSLTPLFAPSAEKCTIKFKVKEGKLKSGAKATLSVVDAAGKTLFSKADLEITQAAEAVFEWDGKGSDGKFAQPLHSPLKATVEVTGDAKSRSDAKESKIEFKEIKITVAGMDANKRIVINVPNSDVEATASVFLKKSDGNGVLTEVPIKLEFSFEDPANDNLEKTASFEYSPGSKLGKRNDAAAIFWKAAIGYTTSSPDSYKGKCVVYERGAVTTLAVALTAKYIGLYDPGAPGKQAAWPADFSPTKLETSPNQMQPTATELADYASANPMKQAVAKLAIDAKAQLWFDAIIADYGNRVSNWFTAAAIPGGNSLLAVQYYHPKLSNLGTDGQTNFWPPGVSINMANHGTGMNIPGHPDSKTWREVQGFNRGGISVIFKNYGSAGRLQIICRHEIGHGTKSAFKRAEFGAGDHSNSGLMTPYGSGALFSVADSGKLRGKS